jgi:hypothetical protein
MPENPQDCFSAIDPWLTMTKSNQLNSTSVWKRSMHSPMVLENDLRRQLLLGGVQEENKQGPQSGPRTGGSGYSGWDALQATA